MGGPELAPHRLLHLLLGVNEIGRLGELVQHLDPQVHGFVVAGAQFIVQLNLVDAEGDALDKHKLLNIPVV